MELAAKADTILSSETASPTEKATFIHQNAWTRVSGSWPDDRRTDLMALVVLDDFPVKVCLILRRTAPRVMPHEVTS